MEIWITRHGQTNLNLHHLMQGRTDEPLNETGQDQARRMRDKIGEVSFDAVYVSPLMRARKTGALIGNIPEEETITDQRLIEVDFGRYEKKKFTLLGPRMTLYWLAPTLFPRPETVESTESMIRRSESFLKELESREYDRVLVACHGGIMRALCGYLEGRPDGLKWYPKPHNCEVRIYEAADGQHRHVRDILL